MTTLIEVMGMNRAERRRIAKLNGARKIVGSTRPVVRAPRSA